MSGREDNQSPRRAVSSSQDRATNPDVEQAKKIIEGQFASLEELRSLAKRLAAARYFGYARRIQLRARRAADLSPAAEKCRRCLGQKHALYTYKDPDLPADQRFDSALQILHSVDDLAHTRDQETLGLAGAIYKYKWAYDAQLRHLERSVEFYTLGYQAGIAKDSGYTAINAAFVMDLLASQEEKDVAGSGAPARASALHAEAARIRQEIADTLVELPETKPELLSDFWFLVTLGEAYFGLHLYDKAAEWLGRATAVQDTEDWQRETSARQLSTLACMQDDKGGDSPAWRALSVFLRHDVKALDSIVTGKMGLALSGGGFRASLFHIGVLARLAELDTLRHIEVLSCVSGGSIVGAHYYLEVRRLLMSKSDEEITRDDYIEIVRTLERDFLAGVRRNLRTRVLAEWTTNVKSVFWPRYSRTERLAEMYEQELYSRVRDGHGNQNRFLNGLKIEPKDAPPHFMPKLDNWRRSAKVPQLVLNATALNTGHTWQFTASFMGEPPGGVSTEVDGNELLRRMYYWEAPEGYREIRLGRAVAASACVPGLFEPLTLDGLFPQRTLQLVDGGVHDNQGVGSLLEQECAVMLVSDASGQMGTEIDPSQEVLAVPMRANGILMARVREAQFLDLQARRKSQLLRGLMFVHLKKDLDSDPVDWVDCTEPSDILDDARPLERRGPRTSYGVFKELQAKLAGIRTDLDSFSDREAYALMWSGYKMTEGEFPKSLAGMKTGAGESVPWQFRQIERIADRDQGLDKDYERLLDTLGVAKQRAGKIWLLSKKPALVSVLFLLLMAGGACLILPLRVAAKIACVVALAGAVMAAVAPLFSLLLFWIFRMAGRRKPYSQILTGVIIACGAFVLARLHLWFYDPVFLNEGRIGSEAVPMGARMAALCAALAALGVAAFFLTRPW